MLRHPVVISTIEEDFQKIGLLSEAKTDQEPEVEKEETAETAEAAEAKTDDVELEDLDSDEDSEESGVTETWLNYQAAPTLDEGEDSDDEDITEGEVAAFEEAVQFAEAFDKEWAECEEGSEIILSKEDMDELEGMGESLGLDFDVLNLDEDDSDDSEDSDEDDDEDDEE